MNQTDQSDTRGTIEETAGCTCVVCVTSRANRRQSELIKQLTAERDTAHATLHRVREMCSGARFGVRRTATIVSLLDERQ